MFVRNNSRIRWRVEIPASYPVFYMAGNVLSYSFYLTGNILPHSLFRREDRSYGKEDNFYGRKNRRTADFICTAGSVCPVFTGNVRSCGSSDSRKICHIGGRLRRVHRLPDYDDPDELNKQLCHGHNGVLRAADWLREKGRQRQNSGECHDYVRHHCCYYDNFACAFCTAD